MRILAERDRIALKTDDHWTHTIEQDIQDFRVAALSCRAASRRKGRHTLAFCSSGHVIRP
jgi:hypothetical protein